MEFSWEVLVVLALVGLLTGVVDAIAGGGGLISVPALMLAGLDPAAAIATNKLQGTLGLAVSTSRFASAKLLDLGSRVTWLLAGSAFAGAVFGAALVAVAPVETMRTALPFLLIAVALYFAVSPAMSHVDARARLGPRAFAALVGFPVGLYDGLFGPGAGSLYMIGLVALLGFGAVKAVAHVKLLNFASNLSALIFFIVAGKVVWVAGFAMAAGTIVGAQIGASLAIRHGVRLVRPLLIVVSLALALRLMLDASHPVGGAVRAMVAAGS